MRIAAPARKAGIMADLTDREILEACARACDKMYECFDSGVSITGPYGRCETIPQWNPLEDDGDCARMDLACVSEIDFRLGVATVVRLAGDIFEEFTPGNDAERRRASCLVVARAQIEREKGGA